MAAAPALSVIVLADRYQTIRRLVEHLCAQTIAGEIELVVACPFPKGFEVPNAAARPLASIKVVEAPLLPMGAARAAAVRAATAPVVVLGETHAFPAPDWAERLLRAHEGPWQAVAPGLENANPESARSWSGFLMDYGHWLADLPGGEIDEPPSYNAAWKRQALIDRPELKELPDPTGRAPLDGARFLHEPSARVAHVNVARRGAWSAERYYGGRLFGARRSRGWPITRRLLYFGGSPLVPLIRLRRTRPAAALVRVDSDLPRGTLVAVALGSVVWALGEAIGYIAGAGIAEARMSEYELHKERYS